MSLRTRMLVSIPLLAAGAAFLVDEASAVFRFDPPWVQSDERGSVRALYFSRTGVGGSYVIDYGRPAWQAEYDAGLDDLTIGKRVRLGQNAWTTLDATCPVKFGDKKEIKPGHYYLALERDKRGEWSLILMESDAIRKKRVDAVQTDTTNGGTAVPLSHSQGQDSVRALTIEMEQSADDEFEQTLSIKFGPHVLSTTMKGKV